MRLAVSFLQSSCVPNLIPNSAAPEVSWGTKPREPNAQLTSQQMENISARGFASQNRYALAVWCPLRVSSLCIS